MFLLPLFMVCMITAYTPTIEECGKTDSITASGVKAIEGRTIACDHLPFYSSVKIDGKEYVVHDRFGGDYTNKIDVFMLNKEDAVKFGVKYKLVEVKLPKEIWRYFDYE